MNTLRPYEVIVIMSPSLTEDQAAITAQEVNKLCEDNATKVLYTEQWGKRKLAYEVKKQKFGHFFFLQVEGEVAAVKEIERLLKLKEHILKFMVTRAEPGKIGKSTSLNIIRPKEEETWHPTTG